MKKLFPLLFLLFITSLLHAATVRGKVTETDQKPADYVSVLLLQAADSQLVKGDVTDASGNFIIEQVKPGNYLLSISAVGFQKTFHAVVITNENDELTQNLVLLRADKALKEVKVISKKPMIEVKADKTVFNVEQSINATGTNALDLLRKSPGVRVDKDDQVSMRGKNNVLIYIDGKPTYMDNKDLANMLKNMQSSDVESIELITNPSAKYDASGNAGIINIRLKRNKRFGTNGSANVGYAIGKFSKYNAGISLNHRKERLNLFGSYNFFRGNNLNFQNFNRVQNQYRYNFKSENIDHSLANALKVGADYYFDKKNVIGFMMNSTLYTGKFTSENYTKIGPADSEVNKVLRATNNIPMKRLNTSFNVNYKYENPSGTTLNMDADYGSFFSTGKSYQPNTYYNANETQMLSQSIFKNNTPTEINIYSFKSDYEHTLWKGKLGLGVKSAYVRTTNTFEFFDVVQGEDTLNLNRTNSFSYNENVNALYLNYTKQWNARWSAQGGLRYEQTNSKGSLSSANPQKDNLVERHYANLFPSAGVTYNAGKNHAFGVTYSKRIDRPSYQDLNPFENKLDELTYEKGNAFLRPQYTNSFELNHTFKQFLTTTLNYSHTRDMFTQTTDTTEFSRTYVTQKNFASQDIYGINVALPLPVRKWWFAYVNLAANYTKLTANFEGRILKNNYPNWSVYADNTITLPKKYALNISGWYSSTSYWGGTFKTKPLGTLDLGLQKVFFDNKLTAKVSVSDIFQSQRWYATSNFAGLYVQANGNYESRQLRLNLNYRFGNNQVAKSRERETGASKESGRIKGK
jgi:outer membrane receptor protein involved in Fe transport